MKNYTLQLDERDAWVLDFVLERVLAEHNPALDEIFMTRDENDRLTYDNDLYDELNNIHEQLLNLRGI